MLRERRAHGLCVLTLALGSGCSEHFLIGSVSDASASEETKLAGEIWLRARGRDRVSRLVAPCPGACTAVEVVSTLEAAPIRVLWSDGVSADARTLCVVGPGLLSVSVENGVSSAAHDTLSLELQTNRCTEAAPDAQPWRVCHRAPLLALGEVCASEGLEGTVFEIDTSQAGEAAVMRLRFFASEATDVQLTLTPAQPKCNDPDPLPTSLRFGPHDVGEVAFELPDTAVSPLLILQAVGGSGEPLPAALQLEAVELCEPL